MTGHCVTCSLAAYGEDQEDFAGMLGGVLAGEGYGLLVDCIACGPALVDDDGRRITPPGQIDDARLDA